MRSVLSLVGMCATNIAIIDRMRGGGSVDRNPRAAELPKESPDRTYLIQPTENLTPGYPIFPATLLLQWCDAPTWVSRLELVLIRLVGLEPVPYCLSVNAIHGNIGHETDRAHLLEPTSIISCCGRSPLC